MVESGGAAEQCSGGHGRSARRRFRRGRVAMVRPVSTSRSRATHSEGRFERRTGKGDRREGGLGGDGGICSGELMAGVAVWQLREVPW